MRSPQAVPSPEPKKKKLPRLPGGETKHPIKKDALASSEDMKPAGDTRTSRSSVFAKKPRVAPPAGPGPWTSSPAAPACPEAAAPPEAASAQEHLSSSSRRSAPPPGPRWPARRQQFPLALLPVPQRAQEVAALPSLMPRSTCGPWEAPLRRAAAEPELQEAAVDAAAPVAASARPSPPPSPPP